MQNSTLELKGVSVFYGGVHALEGVSLSLFQGEIVALMGPNGAGKSTILRAIFGLAPIALGDVLLDGEAIKPVSYEMSGRGIAFVPQGRRVFAHLSVAENLEVGACKEKNKNKRIERIDEVMDFFPMLRQKRRVRAGALSGGEQQLLALARGLILKPRVLLLDEPSLGLSPKMVKEVFAKMKEIHEQYRTSILVVEHNLQSLFAFVNRGYVLAQGRVVAEGAASELVHSGVLERVFLGKQ